MMDVISIEQLQHVQYVDFGHTMKIIANCWVSRSTVAHVEQNIYSLAIGQLLLLAGGGGGRGMKA